MRKLARHTKKRLSFLLALAPRMRSLMRRLQTSSLALALALTVSTTMPGGGMIGASTTGVGGPGGLAGTGGAQVVTVASSAAPAPGAGQSLSNLQAVGSDGGSGVFPSPCESIGSSGSTVRATFSTADSTQLFRPSSERMGAGRSRAVAMVSNTATAENPLGSTGDFAKRVFELGKEAIQELQEDVQGR